MKRGGSVGQGPFHEAFRAYGRAHEGPTQLVSHRLERNVLAAAACRAGRRKKGRFIGLAIAAAAAVAGLPGAMAFVASHRSAPRAPSTATTGSAGPADRSADVDNGAASSQTMELAYGSRGFLDRDTRINVVQNDDRGAEIALLGGSIELSVHHVDGIAWRVRDGAYVVEAVGTRFRVTHTAVAPVVEVIEGRVRVTGPGLSGDGIFVHAGDRPAAIGIGPPPAALPATVFPSDEPPLAVPPRPSDIPSAGTPVAGRAEPNHMPRRRDTRLRDAFREAIHRGDVREAGRLLDDGFPTGAEPFAPRDFLDAGDALSAVGKLREAERSYALACRGQLQTPSCGVATVRRAILRAQASDNDEAIRLLRSYLQTSKDSPLAREATGRLFELEARAGQLPQARVTARAYLDQWPGGPRAKSARDILAHP